jgi:2-methylfumaryl-CoA isomerase
MYSVLQGMRVIEASSFIASPLCGLYLAQMGAEVIRIDTIGGGPDYRRWPRAPHGGSLYWEGLNKAKKSIAINLAEPAGRQLAIELVCAPGQHAGLFVTNYPRDGFLAHERLTALRSDLITVRLMGHSDGSGALDYTINSMIGFPFMTGPAALGDRPVNHALPAWDLLSGAYAAFALLAAERRRRLEGNGVEVCVPLADVAMSSVANLGQVAEVLSTGTDRPRMGNDVYGAFGRDFLTRDGKRLMIVGLTPRQWNGLIEALGIGAKVAAIENRLGLSFAKDEGLRFEHRAELGSLVETVVSERCYAELQQAFKHFRVCWGPYQTVMEAVRDPDGLVQANPMFTVLDNPSGLTYPVPGSAATLSGQARRPAICAPHLGEHTDQVLAEVLGYSERAIGLLHDRGIVAAAPNSDHHDEQ